MHFCMFQFLKRTQMHVLGLPPPNFGFTKKKTNLFFFLKKVGEDKGHAFFGAFWGLKRTKMLFLGLPPPHFDEIY